MCSGVSKVRHLKFSWVSDPQPSYVVEVVGRCNGAVIRGTFYKEGKCLLPPDEVSAISVGQSFYLFFAPAIRGHSLKRTATDTSPNSESIIFPSQSILSGQREPVAARRFPKTWIKAISEVFDDLNANEIEKFELIEKFKLIHSNSVSSFFSETPLDKIDEELWTFLRKTVMKPPFELNQESGIVKYDPTSKPPPKKSRTDDQPPAPPQVIV